MIIIIIQFTYKYIILYQRATTPSSVVTCEASDVKAAGMLDTPRMRKKKLEKGLPRTEQNSEGGQKRAISTADSTSCTVAQDELVCCIQRNVNADGVKGDCNCGTAQCGVSGEVHMWSTVFETVLVL